jgi:hypothetical protein
MGFYDAVVLLDLVVNRKKENIMIANIAAQADPKELRKRLFENSNMEIKLDEVGIETLKQTLDRNSKFKVK